MVTSWPSKKYQKRKKHQKRRSEFKNAQQRRTRAGIEEEKKIKEISMLQDIIEHHKNIISKGKAKNKEARKKMLDRIKQYEQRVLDLSNTKHKEKKRLSEKKANDMLAKYGLKLKPKKKGKLVPVNIPTSLSIIHKSDKKFTPINLQAAIATGYKGKKTKRKK